MSDWGKALADLDAAIRLDPRCAGYYEARASLRTKLGNAKGAEEDNQAAARLRLQAPKTAPH
jgi:hypothetical protein